MVLRRETEKKKFLNFLSADLRAQSGGPLGPGHHGPVGWTVGTRKPWPSRVDLWDQGTMAQSGGPLGPRHHGL